MNVAQSAPPLFARTGAARPAPLAVVGALDFPAPPEPAPATTGADGLPLAASLRASEIRRPAARTLEPEPAVAEPPEPAVIVAPEIRYPLPVPVRAHPRRRRPLWRWLWAGSAALAAAALVWRLIPASEPSMPPTTSASIPVAVAPAAPPPAEEPAVAVAAAPAPAAAQPSEPPPVPAAQTAAVAPQMPAPRPAPATTGKGFFAQVASVRSAGDVDREWARLKREFPRLFNGRAMQVDRADLDERGTYYRLRVGPFGERAAAERLCAQLSARKRDCLVLRR